MDRFLSHVFLESDNPPFSSAFHIGVIVDEGQYLNHSIKTNLIHRVLPILDDMWTDLSKQADPDITKCVIWNIYLVNDHRLQQYKKFMGTSLRTLPISKALLIYYSGVDGKRVEMPLSLQGVIAQNLAGECSPSKELKP